jgi:hypothetical protein
MVLYHLKIKFGDRNQTMKGNLSKKKILPVKVIDLICYVENSSIHEILTIKKVDFTKKLEKTNRVSEEKMMEITDIIFS